MKSAKRGKKGPPKTFESAREAKAALTHLADSLVSFNFPWPAAAIRSYLAGGSQSLDEAFGLSGITSDKAKKPAAKKSTGKPKAKAPAARRRA